MGKSNLRGAQCLLLSCIWRGGHEDSNEDGDKCLPLVPSFSDIHWYFFQFARFSMIHKCNPTLLLLIFIGKSKNIIQVDCRGQSSLHLASTFVLKISNDIRK